MSTLINELKNECNALENRVIRDFGHMFVFHVVSSGYDHTNTSYIICINMFGFEYNLVFDIENDTCYVYDTEHNLTLFEVKNVSDDTSFISDFVECAYKYGMFMHHIDSCNFDCILK